MVCPITVTNIAVLYTGGTIGSVAPKKGDPLGPLRAAQFEAAFTAIVKPIIKNQYPDVRIGYIRFKKDGTTLDSTNLQPSDW